MKELFGFPQTLFQSESSAAITPSFSRGSVELKNQNDSPTWHRDGNIPKIKLNFKSQECQGFKHHFGKKWGLNNNKKVIKLIKKQIIILKKQKTIEIKMY